MPRSKSISLTSRSNGNRKYSRTAWAMVCGGKRWFLQLIVIKLIVAQLSVNRQAADNVTSPFLLILTVMLTGSLDDSCIDDLSALGRIALPCEMFVETGE